MASDNDFDAPTIATGESMAPPQPAAAFPDSEPTGIDTDPDTDAVVEGTTAMTDVAVREEISRAEIADTGDGSVEVIAEGAADAGTDPETGGIAEEGTVEDDAADDEDAQVLEPAAAPAAPTFGLIFQAPDTSAVPRRRPTRTEPEDVDSGDADGDENESDDRRENEVGGGDLGDAGRRAPRRRRGRRGVRDDRGDRGDESAGTSDDTDSGDDDGADDSDDSEAGGRRRRRRGGRGRRRSTGADDDQADSADSGAESPKGSENGADTSELGDDADVNGAADETDETDETAGSRRRTRRRRRTGSASDGNDDPPGTVTRVRESRRDRDGDTATGIKGSTRLEAKRQRRRDGREAGRRRTIITEAQFLARRESVERVMAIREVDGRTEIGVLEDGVLVEHYISAAEGASGGSGGSTSVGNVYLGRVQNVLPSMEAAFVDIGKGRNAVLYAGEVNWDAAGLEANSQRRIENALTSGQGVLVQVTKDPIGHKGARLTSQVSLPGRFLVYVPDGSMTGISRKLPDTERSRLKGLLKQIVPADAGVIVRTAAEGASEEELTADVERLARQWERIQKKAASGSAPALLHGEAGLTVRVVRDVFNEDFAKPVVAGETAWDTVSDYVESVAPDLRGRVSKWTGEKDLFAHYRIDEQLAKAMDRKVWLPSGGSLVIDRTEAMTVIDVNTGKFTGSGGNLEETVTKNNLEAAEEIVRQLRLRDIGGIIVVDFIDMVLESNRDLVVRRLVECLGRDRTKHQVAEVTSLGLVQMTRKRVGAGLIEVFSETCEHCNGRGIIVQDTPRSSPSSSDGDGGRRGRRGGRGDTGRGRDQSRVDSGNGDAPETAAERKGPSMAEMAAKVAAAGRHGDDDVVVGEAADAVTEHGVDVIAPGSLDSETVAEAIGVASVMTSGGQNDDPGDGAADAGGQVEEPQSTRRGRRGGRRAASAPSGGGGSSVGLLTADGETPTAAATPLTQVAGDASVGESGTGDGSPRPAGEIAGSGDDDAAGSPVAASTSRKKPRRRAGSPAGPPLQG